MKWPRVRLTIRWMMVVVAVFAVASLLGRNLWEWWRGGDRIRLDQSQIRAQVGAKGGYGLPPDGLVEVTITYDVKFAKPLPRSGTSCVILASVWFEDEVTKQAVNDYTFDVALTVGGREAASGTFTWDAPIPKPGRYLLRYELYRRSSRGRYAIFSGGAHNTTFYSTTPPQPVAEGDR